MSAITWNQSVITDFRPPWAMNLLTPTAPDWRCSVKHPLQGTPPLVAHRPAASWCWWLPQSWRMHLQHWPGQWWYSTSWPSPQIWKLGRGTGGWSLVASLETLSCVKKRPASWRSTYKIGVSISRGYLAGRDKENIFSGDHPHPFIINIH